MAAVLPIRPPCDSNPATPGAQSLQVTFIFPNNNNNHTNNTTIGSRSSALFLAPQLTARYLSDGSLRPWPSFCFSAWPLGWFICSMSRTCMCSHVFKSHCVDMRGLTVVTWAPFCLPSYRLDNSTYMLLYLFCLLPPKICRPFHRFTCCLYLIIK